MTGITTKIGKIVKNWHFQYSPPDIHHLRSLTTSSKFLRKIPSSLDLKALFVFSNMSIVSTKVLLSVFSLGQLRRWHTSCWEELPVEKDSVRCFRSESAPAIF